MRTAREVIADSRCRRARGLWGDWITMGPADWLEGADADIAALRAEGLVIVAASDLKHAMSTFILDDDVRQRLHDALVAGGSDGQS